MDIADPSRAVGLGSWHAQLPEPNSGVKARLLAAADVQIPWNKPGQQATVHVEITEPTLQAVPSILDPGQDGYHDTPTGRPASIGLNNSLDRVESHIY